jgi:hypothetical protein
LPAPTRLGLLSRDHRSSDQERSLYRESAGRYPTYSVAVRRMLTQRPGLRVAAAHDERDAVVTDFTALLDLLHEDQRVLAAALRQRGTVADPRVACALSGLRRLPSFTGVVFTAAHSPGSVPAGYGIGKILIEPAFVLATSARTAALEADVEYLIWSETGKRTAALAADAAAGEIVFAGGTAYRVLQVMTAGNPAAPSRMRVFLRETATSRRVEPGGRPVRLNPVDGALDEMDSRVLERLVTAAALRDEAVAGDQVAGRPGPATLSPIGVEASGVPFQEAFIERYE